MKIVVYTNSACPHCRALKDYFNEHHVIYQEKNISDDLHARMELISKKILAVPVICVDDEEWIIGYNPAKLEHILNHFRNLEQ